MRTALPLIALLTLSSAAWGANNNPLLVGGPNALPVRQLGPVRNAAPFGAHLTYYGGRVVSNMQVVEVLWGTGGAGTGNGQFLAQVFNTSTPSIATFYQEVLNSGYVDWLTEYNTDIIDHAGHPGTDQVIGRGSFSEQVAITPSTNGTTITDSTIQTEIVNQILAGHLPFPTADAAGNNNTYYAVFFPHGKIIIQGGTSSCASGGFCAYHGTIDAGDSVGEIYYGVHPDMQAGSGCDTGCGNGATPFDNYTSVASHEMAETITDCEVGLATNLAPPLAWYDNTNGEIGDICNAQQGSIVGGDGQTYTVQRLFSNAAGACIVTASSSSTPTATPTHTATRTATPTSTATHTATPTTTATHTATSTPTATATHTATTTPTATGTTAQTATLTSTPTATATHTATSTSTATHTATPTPSTSPTVTATATPTSTATATSTPTATATSTASPTPTPTPSPDFGISAAPASEKVRRGKTATYTITVNPLNGFAGPVTLSISGGPHASTAMLTPNPATTTGSLQLRIKKTAGAGKTFTLTITGVSGSLHHTTTAQLKVTR
jgi:hypothetical protein